MYHGNGSAPVALPRDEPITECAASSVAPATIAECSFADFDSCIPLRQSRDLGAHGNERKLSLRKYLQDNRPASLSNKERCRVNTYCNATTHSDDGLALLIERTLRLTKCSLSYLSSSLLLSAFFTPNPCAGEAFVWATLLHFK